MSGELSGIGGFKSIIGLDHSFSIATGKEAATEAKVKTIVQNVLEHVRNSNLIPSEEKLLAQFTDRITMLDKKFNAAGLGSVFETEIQALKQFQKGKEGVAPSDIQQHPFVQNLDHVLEGIAAGKEAKVATEFYLFQRDHLLPTLEGVQSREEVAALKPLVEKCHSLAERPSFSSDKYQPLRTAQESIDNTFRVQSMKMGPTFQGFVTYQKGDINFKSLEPAERERKAQSVTQWTESFIERMHNPLFTEEDKRAIHRGLSVLYSEYQEIGEGAQLSAALQHLSAELEIPMPTEGRVSATGSVARRRQVFEGPKPMAPKPSSTRAAPSLPSEAARREVLLKHIQENIEHLDVNSRDFKQRVTAIRLDIDQLKPLSSGVDFSSIEESLKLMSNPEALKTSKEESRFVTLLLRKCNILSGKGLEQYMASDPTVMKEGQKTLVTAFKRNRASIEELAAGAKVASTGLKEQCMQKRFEQLHEAYPHLPFARHFPQLVNSFTEYGKETATKSLQKRWEKMCVVYDAQSGGKFSELIKHYPFIDPTAQFDTFVEVAQEAFFEQLDLTTIDTLSPRGVMEHVTTAADSVKTIAGQLFKDMYAPMFSAKHEWLAANAHQIITPHNQGTMKDENLGEGVCWANSLQRVQVLQENPRLPDATIQMGSTQKSRYVQSQLDQYFKKLEKGEISPEVVMNQMSKSDLFGLEEYYQYELPHHPLDTRHAFLMGEIDRYSEAGHTQLVLQLLHPDPNRAAHAVNVQMDPTNNIYRLMDDNIGLVSYGSKEEFKAQMATYFRTFYSDHDTFIFRIFKTQ